MLEGSLERKFGFHIFNSPWPGLGSWCNRDQIAEQVAASRRLSAAQHRRMQSIAEAMLLFGEKSFNFGALHDSPFEIIFRHLQKKQKHVFSALRRDQAQIVLFVCGLLHAPAMVFVFNWLQNADRQVAESR